MDGVGVYDKLVYLLHVGELDYISEIVTNLRLCGCEVKKLSLDKTSLLDLRQRPSDIVVCVFDSTLDYENEPNLFRNVNSKSPLLGIFCGKNPRVDAKFLDQCNEFLYWPCHQIELHQRIERIPRIKAQYTSFAANDGLIYEFRRDNEDRRKVVLDRRISDFYNASYKDTKSKFIENFEKKYLCWIMAETNGNVTRAAHRVGKERRALGKLLKKYNIDKSSFQASTL